jgi:hypothetical protein
MACSKSGETEPTPPEPPADENLRISSNVSSINVTTGADFTFELRVDSRMPQNGVRIEYALTGEADGLNYPQGPAIETTGKKTVLRLQGIPRQKYCICKVTATSKSSASNKASIDFRVVYK